MFITTMPSCKVMNSPLLDMCKQNGKDPLPYLESILAIHKHVEGQCGIMGGKAQSLELVQGWKMSHIGPTIMG